jgi:hypothetical protein
MLVLVGYYLNLSDGWGYRDHPPHLPFSFFGGSNLLRSNSVNAHVGMVQCIYLFQMTPSMHMSKMMCVQNTFIVIDAHKVVHSRVCS